MIMQSPIIERLDRRLPLMTPSTPEIYERSASVAGVMLEAASSRVSEDVAEVMRFITSLPPDTNVYAALIPFLNAKAATCNPRWMSIILVFILFTHIFVLVLALTILSYHLRRGDYWWFTTRQKLFKLDRTLCECLGAGCYALVSIADISSQLYTDYYKTPTPGRILLFWLRWPVVSWSLWCIMWICISTHIQGFWDPTSQKILGSSAREIPKWLVILLNSAFVFFAIVFLLAHPLMGIPSHLIYTQIFNTLRHVTDGLLVASKVPDGNQLSILHLENILYPLLNIPDRTDELAHEVRKSALFLEATNVSLIITYIPFVYLTYRQLQYLKRAQKDLSALQDLMSRKTYYTEELKKLLLEAALLLFVLISYQPLFIWMLTTRTSEKLLLSNATALVPELTVTLTACLVTPFVGILRLISTRRLLIQKRADEHEQEISSKKIAASDIDQPIRLKHLQPIYVVKSADRTNDSDMKFDVLEKSD